VSAVERALIFLDNNFFLDKRFFACYQEFCNPEIELVAQVVVPDCRAVLGKDCFHQLNKGRFAVWFSFETRHRMGSIWVGRW
jgi:hypothetical protein